MAAKVYIDWARLYASEKPLSASFPKVYGKHIPLYMFALFHSLY